MIQAHTYTQTRKKKKKKTTHFGRYKSAFIGFYGALLPQKTTAIIFRLPSASQVIFVRFYLKGARNPNNTSKASQTAEKKTTTTTFTRFIRFGFCCWWSVILLCDVKSSKLTRKQGNEFMICERGEYCK